MLTIDANIFVLMMLINFPNKLQCLLITCQTIVRPRLGGIAAILYLLTDDILQIKRERHCVADDVDEAVPEEEVCADHVQGVPPLPRGSPTGLPEAQGEAGGP